MEHASHPCHQCNAEVEEGNPFCRKCGAPQIRVSRDEALEPPKESPTDSRSFNSPRVVSDTSARGGIDRRLARRLAVLSSLLLVVIVAFSSAFPLILLFSPVPGAFTVWFYLRKAPEQKISLGVGTALGMLTGFFGSLFYTIPSLSFLLWCLTYHPDWRPAQELRSQIETALKNNPSPQLQQMAPFLLSHNGMVFMAIMESVVLFVLLFVFSAIGGAIGASIFGRRR